MSQWTVDYVDAMAREVLERSFIERLRSRFGHSDKPNFDWDKVTGMVVRAWIYAREHPNWMQEVPFEETTERFAELLGWAIEKTTSTGHSDTNAGFTMESLASVHVSRQGAERDLVTDFVNWALRGVAA